MTLRSVVVTTDDRHLAQIAEQRGISRTRLLQMLVDKIVREERAGEIITAADVAAIVKPSRYRRFSPKSHHADDAGCGQAVIEPWREE